MLFTSYRCRSCIQGRRMVHLLNCMLLLKSQMTYWAKVLLIAAGPSAQHPKLLLPPAEKNWQSLWSTQETGWIYSAVTSKEVCLYWFGTGRSEENSPPWNSPPQAHTAWSHLPLQGDRNAAWEGSWVAQCCPHHPRTARGRVLPWGWAQQQAPKSTAFCGTPSEKDGTARFTWE